MDSEDEILYTIPPPNATDLPQPIYRRRIPIPSPTGSRVSPRIDPDSSRRASYATSSGRSSARSKSSHSSHPSTPSTPTEIIHHWWTLRLTDLAKALITLLAFTTLLYLSGLLQSGPSPPAQLINYLSRLKKSYNSRSWPSESIPDSDYLSIPQIQTYVAHTSSHHPPYDAFADLTPAELTDAVANTSAYQLGMIIANITSNELYEKFYTPGFSIAEAQRLQSMLIWRAPNVMSLHKGVARINDLAKTPYQGMKALKAELTYTPYTWSKAVRDLHGKLLALQGSQSLLSKLAGTGAKRNQQVTEAWMECLSELQNTTDTMWTIVQGILRDETALREKVREYELSIHSAFIYQTRETPNEVDEYYIDIKLADEVFGDFWNGENELVRFLLTLDNHFSKISESAKMVEQKLRTKKEDILLYEGGQSGDGFIGEPYCSVDAVEEELKALTMYEERETEYRTQLAKGKRSK